MKIQNTIDKKLYDFQKPTSDKLIELEQRLNELRITVEIKHDAALKKM